MKRKIILILIIVFIILLFPIRMIYKDGGTKEYSAILYKVIKWNTLEGKRGTEIYFFPNNLHSLDYYKDPQPEYIFIYNGNQKVQLNIGSYCLKKENGLNKTICVTSQSPSSFKYEETLEIKVNDKLKLDNENINISKIEVFKEGEIINTKIMVDNLDKTIIVPQLEEGEYIFIIFSNFKEGDVVYSFKSKLNPWKNKDFIV